MCTFRSKWTFNRRELLQPANGPCGKKVLHFWPMKTHAANAIDGVEQQHRVRETSANTFFLPSCLSSLRL